MNIKIKTVICLGSSCHTRGNEETLEAIKQFLNENNLMDKVDLRGQLCSGNCHEGPIIKINDKIHIEITKDNVIPVLQKVFTTAQLTK